MGGELASRPRRAWKENYHLNECSKLSGTIHSINLPHNTSATRGLESLGFMQNKALQESRHLVIASNKRKTVMPFKLAACAA